ncbi:putative cytochrome P450 [Daldinia decipiens]|uniref:putative cytochrome P450 n=1 Tax=Daldinia decipiens TaxID=326647 RepID=UPI0020C3A5C4|nr:putative cytochrome P450 [Daldinia decipiens]KAI1660860.1 putative cytochrome P450 [Daldinia decipiens]
MTPEKVIYPSTIWIAILLFIIWQLSKIGRRPKDYPPGPPTLPLIGNLHQIPTEKRHLQFEQWAREYGPIYSLMLGNRVMIVLNSDQAIKDLVDKRGAIYSSRPESYIGQDILSGGLRVLFMPNHGVWKMARKFVHRILGITAARTYVPYQDLENKAMLLGFLETPDDFISHIRRYTTSLTTQMTFGFRTTTIKDPRFKEIFDTAALLDLIPILRRLPERIINVKSEGREIHERELELFREYYLKTKGRLHDGTAKPCICVDLVNMQKKEIFSDDLAAYISGSLLQAGSETTACILVGFIQAMIIFPEVARISQAELDRVCGDRLPDLNDVSNLPYIRACAKEALRWMPGFLLGIPHAVTRDDTYLGFKIPKDATVILNVWAIHNDPKKYASPREFEPMRYIDDNQTSMDSANNPEVNQRDHFTFGAGRRRCQGMHIADRSLFLAISRLLWAFNFQRAIDPDSHKEIIPDMNDLTEGLMVFPTPFPAKIVPRDDRKTRILREEWDQVSKSLDDQNQWKTVPEGLIWKDEQLSELLGQAFEE